MGALLKIIIVSAGFFISALTTADIGFYKKDGTVAVLFLDNQGRVHFRNCTGTVSVPNRRCAADGHPDFEVSRNAYNVSLTSLYGIPENFQGSDGLQKLSLRQESLLREKGFVSAEMRRLFSTRLAVHETFERSLEEQHPISLVEGQDEQYLIPIWALHVVWFDVIENRAWILKSGLTIGEAWNFCEANGWSLPKVHDFFGPGRNYYANESGESTLHDRIRASRIGHYLKNGEAWTGSRLGDSPSFVADAAPNSLLPYYVLFDRMTGITGKRKIEAAGYREEILASALCYRTPIQPN